MIETNIKNISVEEIMNRIKTEVEKRKQSAKTIPEEQVEEKNELLYDTSFQIMHNDINIFETLDHFQQKEVYEYADFSNYHDEEFVRNCYRGLLKREPDIAGLSHYVQQLRSGEKNKSEIISFLRYSKEGKSRNVKLLGSKKRYLIVLMNKIPILGYIFKWFTTFLTLPRLIKRLNAYENFTYQLHLKNIDNELKLQNALNQKADKVNMQNIQDSFTSLNAFVNTKADKTELESSTNSLIAEIETKADKTNYNFKETYKEEVSFLNVALKELKHPLSDFENYKKNDLYYLLFENVFYNHDVVKNKQKVYLPYIQEIKAKSLPWLDIGCGRGEFLNILKSNDIDCKGVEINTLEYDILVKNGFNVVNQDAVSLLSKTKNKFLGISALQVIEHLDYNYLHEMLKLSFEKIEDGGMIILETINPRNVLGLANFYMDETHKRPIPAEMVAFLLEWYGFKNVVIVYSALLPNNFRNTQKNTNYHDYAVIGYKS